MIVQGSCIDFLHHAKSCLHLVHLTLQDLIKLTQAHFKFLLGSRLDQVAIIQDLDWITKRSDLAYKKRLTIIIANR